MDADDGSSIAGAPPCRPACAPARVRGPGRRVGRGARIRPERRQLGAGRSGCAAVAALRRLDGREPGRAVHAARAAGRRAPRARRRGGGRRCSRHPRGSGDRRHGRSPGGATCGDPRSRRRPGRRPSRRRGVGPARGSAGRARGRRARRRPAPVLARGPAGRAAPRHRRGASRRAHRCGPQRPRPAPACHRHRAHLRPQPGRRAGVDGRPGGQRRRRQRCADGAAPAGGARAAHGREHLPAGSVGARHAAGRRRVRGHRRARLHRGHALRCGVRGAHGLLPYRSHPGLRPEPGVRDHRQPPDPRARRRHHRRQLVLRPVHRRDLHRHRRRRRRRGRRRGRPRVRARARGRAGPGLPDLRPGRGDGRGVGRLPRGGDVGDLCGKPRARRVRRRVGRGSARRVPAPPGHAACRRGRLVRHHLRRGDPLREPTLVGRAVGHPGAHRRDDGGPARPAGELRPDAGVGLHRRLARAARRRPPALRRRAPRRDRRRPRRSRSHRRRADRRRAARRLRSRGRRQCDRALRRHLRRP